MKKLVIGNEAVARGLWEAGCTVISVNGDYGIRGKDGGYVL